MRVSRIVISDPLTWGAVVISVAACALISMRFSLAISGNLLLTGFALAQVLAWILLARGTGRYHRRWSKDQRARVRDQKEQSQRRVDSLRLAFTRQEYEPGVASLEKLVESYASVRRAIGTRRSAPQKLQRKLSQTAADCYDSGLLELERLSNLVRTLHDTGGIVKDNSNAARILESSKRLTEDLVEISLSFSDGSENVDALAAERLVKRLEAFE